MKCNECGLIFDQGDLSQVAYHMHGEFKIESPYNGRRCINDASDVYGDCSRQFACGVHFYLSDQGLPSYNESDEFRQGYYRAEFDDLRDKVIKLPIKY